MDEYKASPQKVYDTPAGTDHQIEVLDVFFGTRVLTPHYDPMEEPAFVAKKGETEAKIKVRFIREHHLKKDEVITAYTPEKTFTVAKGGEKLSIKYIKRGKDKISFEKITATKVGKKVWMVVLCNGTNATLTIELKEKLLSGEAPVFDNPVKFIVGEAQAENVEFAISSDKIEQPNVYGREIKLRPQQNSDLSQQIEILSKRKDKLAYIYLEAKVSLNDATDKVIYSGNSPDFLFSDGKSLLISAKQSCPIDPAYRSHFVLHCTAGNMSEVSVKAHTDYDTDTRKRSKAHKYVMPDGKVITIWPFTERNVWATKAESLNNLKGQMFHVEINYGAPSIPSDQQYNAVADLYIEASDVEECWPIIVPHIEIDRGIPDGHSDPTDFNYNKLYQILKDKGVPIESIPHFDHNRYWEKLNYKIPMGNDKNSWPPILTGDPHKK